MKAPLCKLSLTAVSHRSLLTALAILAALATSLALFFSLGARPAAAQDEAIDATQDDLSEYGLSSEDIEALSEAVQADPEALGLVNPEASKNPDSLNFGSVEVGTSQTQSVTVRADKKGCFDLPFIGCIGNFPVKIDSATVSGDDFSKASDTCSGQELQQGATCSIGVRFGPDNEGFHSGSLSIAPGSIRIINLPVVGDITVPTKFTDGTTVPLSGTGIKIDREKPVVISFSPPDGSKAPASTNITAKFSEDLLASSVGSSSFTLTKLGGTLVPAAVTYDASTDTATLDPNSNLKKGVYKAKLSSAIKDLAGNSLVEKEWTFKVKKKKRR